MLVLHGVLVNTFTQENDKGVRSTKLQILSNGGPKVKLIDVKDSIPVSAGGQAIRWEDFQGKNIQLEVTAGVFQGDRGGAAMLYWGATRFVGVGDVLVGGGGTGNAKSAGSDTSGGSRPSV